MDTDYPRYSDAWFLLIYMWASVSRRNYRGLLQSWWKHFPYIWQQWGRKGGKDIVIPGFSLHSCQSITWPQKPQSAVEGKRGKRTYAAILEFWFSFKCFLNPIQILVRKDLCFPHAVEVSSKERYHPRTENKDVTLQAYIFLLLIFSQSLFTAV